METELLTVMWWLAGADRTIKTHPGHATVIRNDGATMNVTLDVASDLAAIDAFYLEAMAS